MPFVQRKDGKVVGLYTRKQPGYAEEKLADDHKDVVAFREAQEAILSTDPEPSDVEVLKELLTERGVITDADMTAKRLAMKKAVRLKAEPLAR